MEQTVERDSRGQASGEDSGFIAGAAGAIRDRAAEALRNTAADLAEAGKQEGADYMHNAAGGLEDAAERLRERSVEDLIGAFERFARQQPVAAFAGAVLAGFVISRFIKSSD